MDYQGQLDFTNICRLWKDHKELFKSAKFKDGEHILLNVFFNERKEADAHGNTHYIKASCKPEEQKKDLNYFVSSGFKALERNQSEQPSEVAEKEVQQTDLPF